MKTLTMRFYTHEETVMRAQAERERYEAAETALREDLLEALREHRNPTNACANPPETACALCGARCEDKP